MFYNLKRITGRSRFRVAYNARSRPLSRREISIALRACGRVRAPRAVFRFGRRGAGRTRQVSGMKSSDSGHRTIGLSPGRRNARTCTNIPRGRTERTFRRYYVVTLLRARAHARTSRPFLGSDKRARVSNGRRAENDTSLSTRPLAGPEDAGPCGVHAHAIIRYCITKTRADLCTSAWPLLIRYARGGRPSEDFDVWS